MITHIGAAVKSSRSVGLIVAVAVGKFTAAKGGHAGGRFRQHDHLVLKVKKVGRNVELLCRVLVRKPNQPDTSGYQRKRRVRSGSDSDRPVSLQAVSMNPSPRGRSLAYYLVQQHQGFIPHVRHLQTDGGEPLKNSRFIAGITSRILEMSNTGSSELGADEKYEIAVSYGTIISTGVLAILVCSTRLYVRKYVINAFGIDDWACLVGLISVTMFNGVGLAVVHYGVGKHIQHVSQEHLKMWFLLYYICICMYLFVSLAVKSSILLLLRRVFPTPYIQHTTLGLIIFLVLFTISGSIVGAFQCTPPKYAYQLEFLMSPDRAKYCFSTDVTYGIFMYQAATLFACDIIIFLLPFPALMKLHIGSAKKTALLLVFGSGLVACIAPAIRFESIQFYKSGSSDTTYAGASSLYWMAIEYNLGLVAGSLAGLRPLVSKVVTALRSSRGNSAYKSNQFTPSYQLENCDNKHWNSSERSGTKNSRYQGDSVLEATVLGDRSSDDSGRQHILKTQSVSIITEESGDVASLGNTRLPWQGLDQKK